MHFWIDKRSNYGIGQNRSMAGLSHQHRRIRSKSIVTPVRPSTSQPYAKSHHRNRHLDLDHRPTAARIQHSTPESSVLQLTPHPLSSHHVPVIHSVYPREELSINMNGSIVSSRSNFIANQWLPIYLKGGICVATALTLLTLKLYYDNNLTGLQLLTFGSTSVILLTFAIITSITYCRIRRNRLTRLPHVYQELFTEPVILPVNNNQMTRMQHVRQELFTDPVIQPVHSDQMTTELIDECADPPPPYAVAVRLPETHPTIDCSPPPSYEKINII